MVVLDISYNFGKNNTKSITFDTINKDNVDWTFLDNLELRKNNKINLYYEVDSLNFNLKVLEKNQNLHIFLCSASWAEQYHYEEYLFYFVWINNINIYCFIENNIKSEEVINFPEDFMDIFFDGLFLKKPIYFENSESRSKSIYKIKDLPEITEDKLN